MTPITHLESHIDRLILICHELRLENQRLNQQLAKLTAENFHLLAQHQNAAIQIKQVMHQLREKIHE